MTHINKRFLLAAAIPLLILAMFFLTGFRMPPEEDRVLVRNSFVSESLVASENPFDGSPDMRELRKALDIIGKTDLSLLSEMQKKELVSLGITEEDFTFLAEEIHAMQQREGASLDSSGRSIGFLAAVCGGIFLALVGAVLAFLHFVRHSKQADSVSADHQAEHI